MFMAFGGLEGNLGEFQERLVAPETRRKLWGLYKAINILSLRD